MRIVSLIVSDYFASSINDFNTISALIKFNFPHNPWRW